MKFNNFIFVIIFIFINSANVTVLSQNKSEGVKAIRVNEFLNSMGAVSSISRRGETLEGTIDCIKYTGLRWLRTGFKDNAPIAELAQLHKQTGVLLSYGLGSGNANIQQLITDAKKLSSVGALLAIEGANEPNNWGVTYQEESGGRKDSWIPIAKLQRDLYSAVKNDPELKNFSVWSISENGAQRENTGLQFLTIPEGANTLMPDGTKYADYANCHNYVGHPSWKGELHDNQTWLSSDPTANCPVDGLNGNYGITWKKHFLGYTEKELLTLPRVTTETGIAIDSTVNVTEEIQANFYLNLYLSQFKQGWKYTAIYLLKARGNEIKHEKYAFYKLDYKPKIAAHYLHNFTTILTDNKFIHKPGKVNYVIPNQPNTTHDLLLQKSNGKFILVLWGERFAGGTDNVIVKLGKKYKTIKIYDPTFGVSAINTLKMVDAVSLSLTNHPIIIEMN